MSFLRKTDAEKHRLDVGSAAASIQPHVDPKEQAGSLLLIFSNGCFNAR